MAAAGDESRETSGLIDRRRLAAFIILSTFTSAVLAVTVSFTPLLLVDHFKVGEGTPTATRHATTVSMRNAGGFCMCLFTVQVSAAFTSAFLYLSGKSAGSCISILIALTRWVSRLRTVR
jgi:hypothetical protein